jgi:hypothetical protein
VGREGQKKDTNREGRNEGPYLEFAGDVRMLVGKRDSGLGLRESRSVNDVTEYIHEYRIRIDRNVAQFVYLRTTVTDQNNTHEIKNSHHIYIYIYIIYIYIYICVCVCGSV